MTNYCSLTLAVFGRLLVYHVTNYYKESMGQSMVPDSYDLLDSVRTWKMTLKSLQILSLMA